MATEAQTCAPVPWVIACTIGGTCANRRNAPKSTAPEQTAYPAQLANQL